MNQKHCPFFHRKKVLTFNSAVGRMNLLATMLQIREIRFVLLLKKWIQRNEEKWGSIAPFGGFIPAGYSYGTNRMPG
jgi:hypothetical protein